MGERITRWGAKAPPVLWSFAIAVVIGWFISVEWSYPYCQQQFDGPGYAAYGAPLPFVQYGGWSSLHYNFMPHIYVLDVIVLTLLTYPLTRMLGDRFVKSTTAHRVNAVVSCAVAVIALGIQVPFASTFFHPVATLGSSQTSYWSYRPVSITTDVLRYHCSPSSYWFGQAP